MTGADGNRELLTRPVGHPRWSEGGLLDVRGEVRFPRERMSFGSTGESPALKVRMRTGEAVPPTRRQKAAVHPAPSHDWPSHALSLLEKIRLEARITRLERAVHELTSKLEDAESKLDKAVSPPFSAPIATLAPDPYEIVGQIHAVIRPSEIGYVASFLDANLGASGTTLAEAIDGLKDRIITTFERLEGKPDEKLGPGPLKQKRVLLSLIRRL